MAETAKRMGRPPGEPSKVVRLPLPVAALAKRLAEKSLRAGDINAFFDIEARRAATVPLMATSAACGFPSPADDYLACIIQPGALRFEKMQVERYVVVLLLSAGHASASPVVDQRWDLHLFVG